MTVGEMIEALQKFHPNTPVLTEVCGYTGNIFDIEFWDNCEEKDAPSYLVIKCERKDSPCND
jgi:hypothetical protein